MALTNAERQARYKKRLKEAAGHPPDDLRWVTELVAEIVPDVRCELWDYDFRIRCGTVDEAGNTQEISFLRKNLSPEQVEHDAHKLKRRLKL